MSDFIFRVRYDEIHLPVPVKLRFSFPNFNYSTHALPNSSTESFVKRTRINDRVFEITVEDLKGNLVLEIPDDPGNFPLVLEYQKQLIFSNSDYRLNPEDISFFVTVEVIEPQTGQTLSTAEFEVIETFNTNPALRESIYFSKTAFSKFVDFTDLGLLSNELLVILHDATLKIGNRYVISPEQLENGMRQRLLPYFYAYHNGNDALARSKLNELIARTKKHDLSKIFDFVVSIPLLDTKQDYSIGGTFTIETANPDLVTNRDLHFYDLLLEYNNGVTAKILHFDWDMETGIKGNEPVEFAFEIHDIIKSSFALTVKGVNGIVLYQKEYRLDDPEIDTIDIRVPFLRPNSIAAKNASNIPHGKKIRGQVIGSGKNAKLNNLTVLIQGKKQGDVVWRILCATQTDKSGNFSFPYPYGNFVEAQALVSAMPDSPANIEINAAKENETIAEDFLYLLLAHDIETADKKKNQSSDCGCDEPKKAKRLPDQEDLIESDEYTQDVGGACVNLSTPNRTLKEYGYKAIVRITDPDVANYTLEKEEGADGRVTFRLKGSNRTLKRGVVNLENPIRWQDAPDSQNNLSFYQAVTVAMGHILHYKSVFKADGYSLGDLLYSLPLAPGQKKQIVVFDSSHSLTGAETQVLSQGERLAANLVNDRSITDQLSGSISEAMAGSSSATTSGVSAGLGLGGSMGPISGVLGVSGGYANSNSSASQNSSRDVSQFFGETLRNSIMQNAESYRQLNASVITTVREGQQYAVTTEAVANHNHCHSLTMMYFEVLRHYAIFQELSHVEECVFVPLLMTNFTTENISKWKDVLARHLLPIPSSTYLQPYPFLIDGRRHPLLKGFDAIERIRTNYANVEYPNGTYADEQITEISGEFTIRVHIPRPKTRFDRILSFPVVKKVVTTQGDVDVAATMQGNIIDTVVGAVVPCAAKGPEVKHSTQTTEVLSRKAIFDMFMTLDANYETVPPAQCIRVNFESNDVFESPIGLIFHGDATPTPMDFFAGMETERRLWTAYAKILGMSLKELFAYFNNNLVADWDRIFNEHIAPQILNALIDNEKRNLNFDPLGLIDISRQSQYNGGPRVMTYTIQGSTSLKRSEIERVQVNFISPLTASEHKVFFDFVTFQIETLRIDYKTRFSDGNIINRSLRNDLRDGVLPISTPLNSAEKRNPKTEDNFIAEQLIQHLNSNLEHYNKVLWYNLDPDRRYMLLDGFHIQIYNEFGNPIGYRSLASVVKNQMITITGNAMVFPVAAGYRVNQSYILESDTVLDDATPAQITLLDQYKPLTPIPPYRISVPTKGVFLEAIQGYCDSCEKVKPNSSQDWDKFKTEEPTSISPVVTPTPVVTDWKAAFKEFAQPLVNIQTAPAAPAPGAGMVGLSELLGKAGVFNDITGLKGNQENAMKTYLSNQENVRALAEMAKTMAMQEHNTKNSDQIRDGINQARDSGAISDEEHGKFMKQHIGQQIDGGESERELAKAARDNEKPSLADAAIAAAGQGRKVSAQRTDADGNVESVDIEGDETIAEESTDKVGGKSVPVIKQQGENDCWATVATMLMSWKENVLLPINDVLKKAGRNLSPPDENKYLEIFKTDTGLPLSEKDAFIEALGMVSEPPTSYTPEAYVEWLNTYGPIWVTIDANEEEGGFSPHARIITSVDGDVANDMANAIFTFIDPAQGVELKAKFGDFVKQYEQMVTDNRGDLAIQIVHFEERLATSSSVGAVEGGVLDYPAVNESKDFLEKALVFAYMCQDVYESTSFEHYNYKIVDYNNFGIREEEFVKPNGFKARLYVNRGEKKYVLAFAGSANPFSFNSTNLMDWVTNFQQALGKYSSQYQIAKNLSLWVKRKIEDNHPSDKHTLIVCGHSLGGGLATVAANETGSEAYTFNSAGVKGQVWKRATNGPHRKMIHAFFVKGEIVSFLQDNRLTSILYQKLTLFPPALGTRFVLERPIGLPPVQGPITTMVNLGLRIPLHFMENVLKALKDTIAKK